MIRQGLRTAYRVGVEWLFARRRFKLLLREGVPATRRRTLEVASMLDHFSATVRPIRVEAPFGDSMLVLAPHQDDEAIGCGGAIALQVRAGKAVRILLLHDGADEHARLGLTRAELCERRNQESRACAGLLGLVPEFLDLPDLVAGEAAAVEAVRDQMLSHRVDAVFTPWLLDSHPDHRTTNRILAQALQGIRWPVRVFCYEVWGLCLPNVVVRIDEVIDLKRRMLEQFEFANTALDYTNSTIGLNMFRSRLVGSGIAQYVEAFTELPAKEFMAWVGRLNSLPPST